MLAGVGGIDAVLLVVAADESVMPQTREHFDICRLLAVPRGVIVLTKSDLVDAEMLELVQLEVAELVAGTSLLDGARHPGVGDDRRGPRRAEDALASLAAGDSAPRPRTALRACRSTACSR